MAYFPQNQKLVLGTNKLDYLSFSRSPVDIIRNLYAQADIAPVSSDSSESTDAKVDDKDGTRTTSTVKVHTGTIPA